MDGQSGVNNSSTSLPTTPSSLSKMQANAETLGAVSKCLANTVSPDAAARRAAEEQLRQGEAQAGFLPLILQLVRSDEADMLVRQAAGLYFKNTVKRLWDDEEEVQISEADKAAVKSELVPLMIALGTPKTQRLQAQIGEGLSTIASSDFPEKWEGLIDVSCLKCIASPELTTPGTRQQLDSRQLCRQQRCARHRPLDLQAMAVAVPV